MRGVAGAAAPGEAVAPVTECPVCGEPLVRFSGTAAGRAAHVEACLDRAGAPTPTSGPEVAAGARSEHGEAVGKRRFLVQPRLPASLFPRAAPEPKAETQAQPSAKRPRRSWWGGAKSGVWGGRAGGRGHKPWRLVPGAPGFAVDVAGAWGRGGSGASYFLSHFHSDHYGGLSEAFEAGDIYCTPATARLVHARLKVAWERLRPRALNQPFFVDGIRCVFLDAHHCPGSAMILFEPPGRPPVLHTGDCRCCPEMRQEPLLAGLAGGRGRVSLFLDTTYACSKYDFPPQADAVAYVVDTLRRECSGPGRLARTLVLFGTYTIGKEKVFLHAAREFDRRVCVSREKRAVLDLLDLPESDMGRLTTNPKEANFRVVPMMHVRMDILKERLEAEAGKYDRIVGFRPTGWSTAGKGSAGHGDQATLTASGEVVRTVRSMGKRQGSGNAVIYSVPYSEHSSFGELRSFVQWLRPAELIPTVGNDGGPKAAQLVELLTKAHKT